MNKTRPSNSQRPWFSVSSPNGLAEVHWLHVGQGGRKKVSKERREIFMKGSVQDVRGDFQVSIKVIYTSFFLILCVCGGGGSVHEERTQIADDRLKGL